jgi:hypothetical protein
MDLDRRSLMLGGTFAAMAAGAAAPAEACSRVDYWPTQGRFWSRLWAKAVTAPRQEQRFAHRWVEAIAWGSVPELEQLLAPGALMFEPPDGTRYWQRPARRYGRAAALKALANFVDRKGKRDYRIHYFGEVWPHSQFLLHATISGYGPPIGRRPYGSLCGEDPNAWERRLVMYIRPEPVQLGEPLRAGTIVWMSA